MTKRSGDERYTDPELRERIKSEIRASDKGGEPGQWSARKSQLLTREYERRGGGYRGGKSESQRSLEKWTEEEWQTREGDTRARLDDGETSRYLPKKAWEALSEEEKEETDHRKREGSREGEQHVPNTGEAKRARESAHKPPIEDYDELNVEEIEKRLDGLSGRDLEQVRRYERANGNRKTLLESLDRKL